MHLDTHTHVRTYVTDVKVVTENEFEKAAQEATLEFGRQIVNLLDNSGGQGLVLKSVANVVQPSRVRGVRGVCGVRRIIVLWVCVCVCVYVVVCTYIHTRTYVWVSGRGRGCYRKEGRLATCQPEV